MTSPSRITGLNDTEKVRISPPLVTGDSEFEIVAVNKDQVIYVGESAG